jgi:5-(carboxyamino)imidazole ribonucleotide synthase
MKHLDSRTKVGILGGGQLARMLALQAFPLGLEPWVLSEHRHDPAAQVTAHWVQGNPNSAKDLADFFARVDVVTFESEFLDADLLKTVAQGKTIWPQPQMMGLLQDRLTQKQLLQQHKITTAEFREVTTPAEAQDAFAHFGGKMILKQRRFGYDGHGTFVIRSPRELRDSLGQLVTHTSGFIAEPIMRFKRELAVMAARRVSGQIEFLPWVESHQVNSRCLWAKGPIKDRRAATFARSLRRFLQKIEYVGVMAFECFDTASGLLVNELAPRVHNTGHYSLEALREDQFTLHLKAILDIPFAPVQLQAPGFAMINLLGEGVKAPHWQTKPFVNLHWYGKNLSQTGRKMGHLTAVATNSAQALQLVKRARKDFHI